MQKKFFASQRHRTMRKGEIEQMSSQLFDVDADAISEELELELDEE